MCDTSLVGALMFCMLFASSHVLSSPTSLSDTTHMLKLQMNSLQNVQIDAQQPPTSAGGDWGTLICFLLGTRHSDHCKAIHTLARSFPKLRHPWHVAQLLNHRLPILNKVIVIKCDLRLIYLDFMCK